MCVFTGDLLSEPNNHFCLDSFRVSSEKKSWRAFAVKCLLCLTEPLSAEEMLSVETEVSLLRSDF